MSHSFIPFKASSLAHRKPSGFVPTVLPPPTSTEGEPVTPSQMAVAHPPSGPPPTLEVQKDGDRIAGITVRCSCGQVIQLECQT